MKLPFYICLPRKLAFLPRSTARRPNEWFRQTVVEAAHAVGDRLEHVEQLQTGALAIDALVCELEWSWRRLDMPPPTHEDDQDLAVMVRATRDSVQPDLENCARLLHQVRGQIAEMLGTTDREIMLLRDRADKSVENIFRQQHNPAHNLNDEQIIALLAVACDCVNAPTGEHLGPVYHFRITFSPFFRLFQRSRILQK